MTDLLGNLAPHHPARYWVWSERHTGYHVRGRYGFAGETRFAGKFTRAEAAAIVAEGNGDRVEPAHAQPKTRRAKR